MILKSFPAKSNQNSFRISFSKDIPAKISKIHRDVKFVHLNELTFLDFLCKNYNKVYLIISTKAHIKAVKYHQEDVGL